MGRPSLSFHGANDEQPFTSSQDVETPYGSLYVVSSLSLQDARDLYNGLDTVLQAEHRARHVWETVPDADELAQLPAGAVVEACFRCEALRAVHEDLTAVALGVESGEWCPQEARP